MTNQDDRSSRWAIAALCGIVPLVIWSRPNRLIPAFWSANPASHDGYTLRDELALLFDPAMMLSASDSGRVRRSVA